MARHPKVMDLTLDPKLTYTTLIHNISVHAHKPLQIIKALTATGWGKQNETLMVTYKAVMRPDLKRYFPASLVLNLPNSEKNLPSSNHTYTKSTPNHIHHHYAPSVTPTPTHTTHTLINCTHYAPHCHPWICGQTPME